MTHTFQTHQQAYDFFSSILKQNDATFDQLEAVVEAQRQKHMDAIGFNPRPTSTDGITPFAPLGLPPDEDEKALAGAGNGLTFTCIVDLSKHGSDFSVAIPHFRNPASDSLLKDFGTVEQAVKGVEEYLDGLSSQYLGAKFVPAFFTVSKQPKLNVYQKLAMSCFTLYLIYHGGKEEGMKVSERLECMGKTFLYTFTDGKCVSQQELEDFEKSFGKK